MSDKISKAVFDLVSVAKDTTISNILKAVRMGELKIEAKQLEMLFSIISASMNDSYQNSVTAFVKSIDTKQVDSKKNA
jgi:hypothetical protein